MSWTWYFIWISGDLLNTTLKHLWNCEQHAILYYHVFKAYSWLNVDFNPLELFTNICGMFETIEFDTKTTVCLEHMVSTIKNWTTIITNKSPEIHVKLRIELTPVVSTLELSKTFHKKTLVIRTLLDFEFSIFVIFYGSKFEKSQFWCFKVSSVFTIISALSKLFKYI